MWLTTHTEKGNQIKSKLHRPTPVSNFNLNFKFLLQGTALIADHNLKKSKKGGLVFGFTQEKAT